MQPCHDAHWLSPLPPSKKRSVAPAIVKGEDPELLRALLAARAEAVAAPPGEP